MLPHWFSREGGGSDSDSIQRAIDSCAGECTLVLTKSYSITKVSRRLGSPSPWLLHVAACAAA